MIENRERLRNLADAINTAIERRLCFYAYAFKGEIDFGACRKPLRGLHRGGFVIAPFDNNPDKIMTIMPEKSENSDSPDSLDSSDPFPALSTPRESHAALVRDAIASMKSLDEKIVCSRVAVGEAAIDIGATFLSLHSKDPNAFTFCFFTPATDIYIGASPEVLLRKDGQQFRTMALAGTKDISDPTPWDIKNIKEHNVVIKYILSVMEANGIKTHYGKTRGRMAGNVAHLFTPIDGVPANESEGIDIEVLLNDLSPTPALCGFPKRKALDFIREREDYSRGYYGGYCGPVEANGDFRLFVNLRSARVTVPDADGISRYAIFAGGGINRMSDPDEEWTETEKKMTTIRRCLVAREKGKETS